MTHRRRGSRDCGTGCAGTARSLPGVGSRAGVGRGHRTMSPGSVALDVRRPRCGSRRRSPTGRSRSKSSAHAALAFGARATSAINASHGAELRGFHDVKGADLRDRERRKARSHLSHLSANSDTPALEAGVSLRKAKNIAANRRQSPTIASNPWELSHSWLRLGHNNRAKTRALKHENPAVSRAFVFMELGGLEPPTSWVRSRRSPN
jgi:hypothetical protein